MQLVTLDQRSNLTLQQSEINKIAPIEAGHANECINVFSIHVCDFRIDCSAKRTERLTVNSRLASFNCINCGRVRRGGDSRREKTFCEPHNVT